MQSGRPAEFASISPPVIADESQRSGLTGPAIVIHRAADSAVRGEISCNGSPGHWPLSWPCCSAGSSPPAAWPRPRPGLNLRRGTRPATAASSGAPVQTPSLPPPNPAGAAPSVPQPVPPPGQPPLVRSLVPTTPNRTGTEALDKVVRLKESPTEPTDVRFPINLATALRLADARPIMVAAAQAGVWVAEAQLTRARVLWVPTLNIGFDYIRHDGGGPDFNKGIMTAPSVNFFYGGAGAIQNVALTDAIFQPLAARQNLNARHWEIQTAKNDALMATAMAYFTVHQSRGSTPARCTASSGVTTWSSASRS